MNHLIYLNHSTIKILTVQTVLFYKGGAHAADKHVFNLCTLASLEPERPGAAGAECVHDEGRRNGQTGGRRPGQNPARRVPWPEPVALWLRRDKAPMTPAPLERENGWEGREKKTWGKKKSDMDITRCKRGIWKWKKPGTKRKREEKRVWRNKDSMFHYDNSPWTTTHGIFTLNLKLITPELLASVLTVTITSLAFVKHTHIKCAKTYMYMHAGKCFFEHTLHITNTCWPTLMDSWIAYSQKCIHQKVKKTMPSHCLFGCVVLAAITNTEPVPLLPNTMERKTLYFSGKWLAELIVWEQTVTANPPGRA